VTGEAFRVLLEHIVVKPPVVAGMDYADIGGKLKALRTTTDDDWPVLLRRREGLPEPYWELSDGRHRYLAALIAGRRDVLAVEEQPT
jgi:hypothetical protein